jgi:DNA polymerase
MKKIYIDFETRSCADIKTVGAWKYAMDPTTEIMCMAWNSGGRTQVWTGEVCRRSPRTWMPPELFKDLIFVSHSAHFEYAIWNYILHKRFGWPALWEPQRWRCTLAKAAMCNLPLSLDQAGAALSLTTKKDLMGRAAMLKLTKPLNVDALGFPTYNEDEELKKVMYEYCRKDVESEMELDARLPDLPPAEQKLWELDLTINHRGVRADTETAAKAMGLASVITTELNSKLLALTGGQVTKASQNAEICRWLTAQGVAVPTKVNPKKKVVQTIDKNALLFLLLHPEVLSPPVREVLAIRQQVGKSSTSKYETILDYAHPEDHRMRGMLQYHAAGTGRWGGRGPQPQNFPKGIGYNSDLVGEDIRNLTTEEFRAKYKEKSMDALSAALRGCMTADEGKTLVSLDFEGIETCVLMWMAGEEEALKFLRSGKNLYIPMAEHIYKRKGLSKEKDQKEYAVGKATILGAGFQMWWPRHMEECQKLGIRIGSDRPTDQEYSYEEDGEQTAEDMMQGRPAEKVRKVRWMTEEEVEYRDSIVAYREKYAKVPKLWKAMEAAAIAAVRNPGKVYPVANVKWGMDPKREFLVCRLPSGRHLRYFHPSTRVRVNKWGKEKISLHSWGEDTKTHKWCELHTYGGKLTENVVQAEARCFLAHGMLCAEAAGFPLVLDVHDELVAEVDDRTLDGDVENFNEMRLEELEKVMCAPVEWGKGCPLSADGWVAKRYRKE